MTLHDIEAAVAAIAKHAQGEDYEVAHLEEDALLCAFTRYVAAHGPPDLAALAKAVLKTQDLYYSRWYA
jgi:hypothetical protein